MLLGLKAFLDPTKFYLFAGNAGSRGRSHKQIRTMRTSLANICILETAFFTLGADDTEWKKPDPGSPGML